MSSADAQTRSGGTGSDGVRVLSGHSMIYAASSLLGQIGSLLTFPLYTRALGVEQYGVLALVLSAAGILKTLVIAGMNTALMHERISAKREDVGRITGAAFVWVLAASALLGVLTVLAYPWLVARRELIGGGDLVAVAVVYVAFDSLYELVLAVARAESRPVDYAYSNAVRVGVTVVAAGALLVLADAGPAGALVGMAAGSFTAGGWLAARLGLRPSFRGTLRWVPRLLRQGGPLVPTNLASWVSNLADRYLLLMFLGSTAVVGLYSAGYRLGALVTVLFVGPFHTAFLPLMLRHVGSREGDATYGESSRLFVAFGSVVVCALQALAVPGVLILAGSAYAGAERVVGPVAFGCLLSGAAMLMTPSAVKTGRSSFLAIAYGVGALANIGLNIVLIPTYGMEGAAAATLAGYAITLGTLLVLMPKQTRPPGVVGTLARVLPIMSAATIPSMVSWGSPGRQMLMSVALGVSGTAALIVSGVLRADDLVFAVRSVWSLPVAAASRIVPRTGRFGPRVRRSAKLALRTPGALWRVLAARYRRARRAGEHVGGDCCVDTYLDYLVATPAAFERAVAGAERIMVGEMVTFAHEWSWAGPADWHLDPISGRRWPMLPAGMIDVNHVEGDSDVQCVWETSRLEHVWRVALCYAKTDSEECAEWAVRQLEQWRQANPVGWGVNWTVAMEVAMRSIAIAEVRSALAASPLWTQAVERETCQMLADHVEWVLANLERRGKHTQNHYLVSLAGVIAVALHLPEWTRLQQQSEWAYEAFFECILDQVTPDGVSFENSLGYHLLVAEVIGYGLGVCRSAGVRIPSVVTDRLKGMVRFAFDMQFGDGSPVDFGDDDDDFLLPGAAEHYDQARPSTGPRIEYAARIAGVFDLGAEYLSDGPIDFPDGGVYVLGDRRMKVFVNAMPTGVRGTGPHRHNDALSFCLEVASRPVLVDPGTFRYQSGGDERNRYRSVAAHNTVQVDDAEQNELRGLFALGHDRIRLHDVEVNLAEDVQLVAASHDGYVAPTGVTHRRAWEYDPAQACLVVTDTFSEHGPTGVSHRFTARFHFDPSVTESEPAVVAGGSSSQGLSFEIGCGSCRLVLSVRGAQGAEARLVGAMHSPRYRVEVPAQALEVSWTGGADSVLVTSVFPVESGA